VWFDCRPFVREGYPFCYSAQLHRHLSLDAGATAYATFSSHEPYDVTLFEITMGAAIHEWRDDAGRLRYAATSPGAEWTDQGAMFYASTVPGFGLSPVHEREAADGFVYTLAAGDDGAAAFYALSTLEVTPIRSVAVRAGERDGVPALTLASDGTPVFYVPCAGAPTELSSCE
jgi:hypothetical protein